MEEAAGKGCSKGFVWVRGQLPQQPDIMLSKDQKLTSCEVLHRGLDLDDYLAVWCIVIKE